MVADPVKAAIAECENVSVNNNYVTILTCRSVCVCVHEYPHVIHLSSTDLYKYVCICSCDSLTLYQLHQVSHHPILLLSVYECDQRLLCTPCQSRQYPLLLLYQCSSLNQFSVSKKKTQK